MREDTDIIELRQPHSVDDPLTEIAREGARRMLAAALRAEADAFVEDLARDRLPDGRQRVVRHGYGPEREIQTGIGGLVVRRPKVRDRACDMEDDRVRFTSAILPRGARRSHSLDALLPVLYLRGISTGDFQEALTALLGQDAPNLSPGVISRLTGEWEADYARWQRRDLSARRYAYVWADGVYLQARMEPQAECMLVLIAFIGLTRPHLRPRSRFTARGEEGAGGLPGGDARECPELARVAGRHQGAGPGMRPGDCRGPLLSYQFPSSRCMMGVATRIMQLRVAAGDGSHPSWSQGTVAE